MMDPVHLLPEELDYELDIRGVYNLSTARQKTSCLREFMRREGNGERTISIARICQINPTVELAYCERAVRGIFDDMMQPGFDPLARGDVRSRLLHLIARVKRTKPVLSEEQTMMYELLQNAEMQLGEFTQAVPPQGASAAPTQQAGKSTSPLADVIATLHAERAGRPTDSPNVVGRAQGAQTQHQWSRQSFPNPHVQDFVPASAAKSRHENVASLAAMERPGTSADSRCDSRNPFSLMHRAEEGAGAMGHAGRGDSGRQHVDSAHGRSESIHGSDSGRDRRSACRTARKTVPVHQWKLSYSGEEQGLHLYDFLSELRMFQMSEGVSDEELFCSIVHLLTGRARLWFRSWFDSFEDWGDLVAAMKREFLPPKYDYKLLASLSNRKQKPTETFAEYMNVMQSLFSYLSIPINAEHKLSIVEDNMLPKYAIAVAALDITSLAQLSRVCHRIDFAYAKTSPVAREDGGAS